PGPLLKRFVIDLLSLLIRTVVRDLLKFDGKICRMPVAEMPSVREVHRQNFVPRFNGCEIDSHVRLRAAVRLHVYMLAAEEPLRAINGQLLSNIDILTAAVPALSSITFGLFVRENTEIGRAS